MHTLFPLQSQLLWSSQITIPPLDRHFPLKSPLPPDSNELKPMSSSTTKSSAPSASHLQTTPEVWAECLLDFHKCYLQGDSLMLGTLKIDTNLWNELCTLVEEIHTSPNPGIDFNHYITLLQFNPNNPVLSNWLTFTQEFPSKFGVFDTVVEAEENLFNLWMHNNKHFMIFIIWFKSKAYKTGWNYNALRFALYHALPQHIKDILCLAPKQTTYNGYKALITQVNQCYWEDWSENMALQTTWNASGNTDWQARATNGN
ncbi:hypothetical protein E4T56_gene11664 [Termitomyces sp. T112]|nr:hypothetical protein E4T56_gene11664 [Termitomyces sp. T112]